MCKTLRTMPVVWEALGKTAAAAVIAILILIFLPIIIITIAALL